MIDIKPKIHDNFTLEFKVGYVPPAAGAAHSDFHMNTWIFIPEVLDVNRHTYLKNTFYSDTRSYLRFITPPYSLAQLAAKDCMPFARLAQSCASPGDPDFQRKVKMYASIVKSSVRDACAAVGKSAQPVAAAEQVVDHIITLLRQYRGLRKVLTGNDSPEARRATTFYDFGDEFISNVVEQHLGRLREGLGDDVVASELPRLNRLLAAEHGYRLERGYLNVEAASDDNNRQFVYHASQLKKYIESDLYLPTHKRRNTVFLEQVAFSLAAGVSMIFATVVSFAFQQTYGNFTLPFFCALVISYMFKDRIKDLIRNYFSNNLGSRFYDYRISIRVRDHKIGWLKEGFDFVSAGDVSRHVQETRARKSPLVINRGVDEQVIQHRKFLHLKQKAVNQLSHYPFTGINDITRYNLGSFMRKMDNPTVPLHINDGSPASQTVAGDKAYYLNFVIQCKYDGKSEYKRYRVCLRRDGIQNIKEIPQ